MAIYHLSIKIISRGKGKSAVAAVAYRSGEKITNTYDGITHDFTKKGGIVYTEILLPDHAPREYADRSTLWNAVEQIEKSKTSQLAREIEIALPRELSAERQKSLVREYCQKHFVSIGMCADICIHDKKDGNPHAHIMLTMRPFEVDGCWGKKQKKEYIFDENGKKIYDKKKRQYKCNTIQTTNWNEQTKAEEWRSGWANICNEYLANANVSEYIDHRSFVRQGIELKPTIHLGVAVTQMERRGIATERGEWNQEINCINKELKQVKARLNKLYQWLEETKTDILEPHSIIGELLNWKENQTQQRKILDLKMVAKIHNFLSENGISTMSQLQEKVTEMREQLNELSSKIKANERRLKTLVAHIEHGENYLEFKKIYNQYKQQKPNKQEDFRQVHAREIILYEAAKKYLDKHMNGHTTLPIKSWKAEQMKLRDEKDHLYQKFTIVKETVREMEIIKQKEEQVIRNIEREHEMGLTAQKSEMER